MYNIKEDFLLEVKDFTEVVLKEMWSTSILTEKEFLELDSVARGNELLNTLKKYGI